MWWLYVWIITSCKLHLNQNEDFYVANTGIDIMRNWKVKFGCTWCRAAINSMIKYENRINYNGKFQQNCIKIAVEGTEFQHLNTCRMSAALFWSQGTCVGPWWMWPHYSEITVCVLYGVIPSVFICVFPYLVRQLFIFSIPVNRYKKKRNFVCFFIKPKLARQQFIPMMKSGNLVCFSKRVKVFPYVGTEYAKSFAHRTILSLSDNSDTNDSQWYITVAPLPVYDIFISLSSRHSSPHTCVFWSMISVQNYRYLLPSAYVIT